MMSSRSARVVRGTIAASFATTVALFSHVLAGGDLPGPLGIVAPLILSITASVLLAGQRLSLVRLAISVAVSQFLFHTLFVLGTPSVASSAGQPGHNHTTSFVIPSGVGIEQSIDASAMMWLGHVVAAAITIAALFNAERVVVALATLARRFRIWWTIVTGAAPIRAVRGSEVPSGTTSALPQLRLDSESALRRGPPLLFAH